MTPITPTCTPLSAQSSSMSFNPSATLATPDNTFRDQSAASGAFSTAPNATVTPNNNTSSSEAARAPPPLTTASPPAPNNSQSCIQSSLNNSGDNASKKHYTTPIFPHILSAADIEEVDNISSRLQRIQKRAGLRTRFHLFIETDTKMRQVTSQPGSTNRMRAGDVLTKVLHSPTISFSIRTERQRRKVENLVRSITELSFLAMNGTKTMEKDSGTFSVPHELPSTGQKSSLSTDEAMRCIRPFVVPKWFPFKDSEYKTGPQASSEQLPLNPQIAKKFEAIRNDDIATLYRVFFKALHTRAREVLSCYTQSTMKYSEFTPPWIRKHLSVSSNVCPMLDGRVVIRDQRDQRNKMGYKRMAWILAAFYIKQPLFGKNVLDHLLETGKYRKKETRSKQRNGRKTNSQQTSPVSEFLPTGPAGGHFETRGSTAGSDTEHQDSPMMVNIPAESQPQSLTASEPGPSGLVSGSEEVNKNKETPPFLGVIRRRRDSGPSTGSGMSDTGLQQFVGALKAKPLQQKAVAAETSNGSNAGYEGSPPPPRSVGAVRIFGPSGDAVGPSRLGSKQGQPGPIPVTPSEATPVAATGQPLQLSEPSSPLLDAELINSERHICEGANPAGTDNANIRNRNGGDTGNTGIKVHTSSAVVISSDTDSAQEIQVASSGAKPPLRPGKRKLNRRISLSSIPIESSDADINDSNQSGKRRRCIQVAGIPENIAHPKSIRRKISTRVPYATETPTETTAEGKTSKKAEKRDDCDALKGFRLMHKGTVFFNSADDGSSQATVKQYTSKVTQELSDDSGGEDCLENTEDEVNSESGYATTNGPIKCGAMFQCHWALVQTMQDREEMRSKCMDCGKPMHTQCLKPQRLCDICLKNKVFEKIMKDNEDESIEFKRIEDTDRSFPRYPVVRGKDGIYVVCSARTKCVFKKDPNAQCLSAITGACKSCKNPLHDLCGGGEDGAMLCFLCEPKQTE